MDAEMNEAAPAPAAPPIDTFAAALTLLQACIDPKACTARLAELRAATAAAEKGQAELAAAAERQRRELAARKPRSTSARQSCGKARKSSTLKWRYFGCASASWTKKPA
jgi:uncharacterized protein with von Willebrand factor type A (vWA) domain